MTASRPDLTLLVPCFEEGERIPALLAALGAWVEARPDVTTEVLCVDDGSRDDTADRLQAALPELPVLRILRHEQNRGKGAALRTGMAASRGDVVLFLDADLAVDLSHVEPALAVLAQGADVAVGCRNLPGARVQRPQGPVRRTLGRVYRRLSSWWLQLEVADVTCGFKAFRGDLGRVVFGESRCARWGFDAEVLYLAQRRGAEIRGFPVQWFHGETSAVRLGRDVFGALWELVGVRVRSGRAVSEGAVSDGAGAERSEALPGSSAPEG